MSVVWKYDLPTKDHTLLLPEFAEVIHVDMQNDIPRIWVLIDDPHRTRKPRRFKTYETGKEFPPDRNRKYIGTFFSTSTGRDLVWHVFEE